jgi:hypothetical protein
MCSVGVHMPDDMTWRLVEPGEEISFTFDGRGRGRQNNSQEIKINQLLVRMDGWQGTKKYHPMVNFINVFRAHFTYKFFAKAKT